MCAKMTMIAIELQAGELKHELRLGHPRAPPMSHCAGLLTDWHNHQQLLAYSHK